ncbi:hypothetical protein ACLMJK_003259 [Lecanora helva]
MAVPRCVTALACIASVLSVVQAVEQAKVQPQPALLPAVHWDHDKADLQHLLPVDSHKLYYSAGGTSDPTIEHAFAHLSASLTNPAVILDHSDYIKSVQCLGKNLEIIFTDTEAYTYAQKAWASEHDFVLATYTEGCGTSTDQRTFWLIDHLVSGPCPTCITAVVQKEIGVEDAVHGVDMVWGTYKPAGTSASPSASGPGTPVTTSSSSTASPKARRSRLRYRQAVGDSACGAPPSRQIDGFPAATCNSTTFDQDLDDAIGYYDFDAAHYSESLRGFAPGLGDFDPDDNEGFQPISSSRTSNATSPLQRRQGKKSSSFGDRLASLGSRLIKGAGNKLRDLGNAVLNGAKEVGNRVSDALAINKSIPNTGLDLRLAGPKLTDSPFGPAVNIFNRTVPARNRIAGTNLLGATGQLAAYCVGCGLGGRIELSGQAAWTIADGLKVATVSLNGNLEASLAIGIDANVEVKETFNSPIAQAGIPGFSVSGLFTVGPAIALYAYSEVGVSLAGQVLAGVSLNIPNFGTTLDFVNGQNSKSVGFTPQLTPTFRATAQFSGNVAFGLPVSVGAGLYIPALKGYEKTASVRNLPSIQANLNYTASTQCQDLNGNTACINGIGYSINFENQVIADLFGLTKYNLNTFSSTLTSGCARVGPQLTCPAGGSSKRGLVDESNSGASPQLRKRQGVDGPGPYDYVTAPATNATAGDDLFQSVNQTAFDSIRDAINNVTATTNATRTGFAPDNNFTTITDFSGNDELVADEDGNIYYGAPGEGSPFATVSGYVEGDADGRFFHYYTDIMTAYNVSRLRLSNESYIPVSSDFVGFAPINYDDNSQTRDAYVAIDTVGAVFFPVTCDIQGQPSKAFLVTDITEGTRKLQDPSLRYTVTGGVVETCYFLPWAAPPGSAATLASSPESLTSATTSASPSAASPEAASAAPSTTE